MGRELEEYVVERRELGERAFQRRYDHPFIIRDSDEIALELESVGNDLDTDVSNEQLRHALDTDKVLTYYEPIKKTLEMFPVLKREGGAFPDQIGVGRAPNADVCIPHGQVSKYHAFFTQDDAGVWRIADAESTNGTWVEGHPLDPGHKTIVDTGTRLRFGPFYFIFLTAEGFHAMVEQQLA